MIKYGTYEKMSHRMRLPYPVSTSSRSKATPPSCTGGRLKTNDTRVIQKEWCLLWVCFRIWQLAKAYVLFLYAGYNQLVKLLRQFCDRTALQTLFSWRLSDNNVFFFFKNIFSNLSISGLYLIGTSVHSIFLNKTADMTTTKWRWTKVLKCSV